MPHSILILDVNEKNIFAELKIPLEELQLAVSFDVTNNQSTLLQNHYQDLARYLSDHIHPKTMSGESWEVELNNMSLDSVEQEATDKFTELTVTMLLTPPNQNTRHFALYYDGVVHQLVTHKVLVAIRNDFATGKLNGEQTGVGLIYMNPADNIVAPLEINLEEGSAWKGFKEMTRLGIHHIAEGTDHLLFLLVLLLPAPLIAEKKRWTKFGGTKYTVIRLVKIATAFTVGHSVSLILGSLKWLVLPQQPVEIAIAFTILITAIHAIRPLFLGKEIMITAGFGLIHGLAFSSVLSELNLEGKELAISILGFNIGIELMQLFVILSTVPWLMVLSKNNSYHRLRRIGATCAAVASIAWIIERITNHQNMISKVVEQIALEGKWFVLGLACIAIFASLTTRPKENNV